MARRRGIGSRRGRGNFAKKRFAWTSAVFGVGMDIAGTPPDLMENIVVDPMNDFQPGTDYNRKYNVRRILVHGAMQLVPNTTAAQVQGWTYIEALYVIDREDQDASLVTTDIGDILEGGADRVLYTNVHSGCTIEGTTAQVSSNLIPGERIDIDWKGNVKVGLDQLIVYAAQFTSDVSGAMSSATIQVITRALFEAV